MDQPELETSRRVLSVCAADGAVARVQMHLPAQPRAALYWMPALGVGIGPNETFADAMARRGIAVAVHEWRGLGESNRRASRRCDWGYRELFEYDLPAGQAAAREALPTLRWHVGGHSLGGQFALIEAARQPQAFDSTFLVASGQPYWRGYGLTVAGLAMLVPVISTLVGYFPGSRLRFAGREARRLMLDWSRTARRGDYRLAFCGETLNEALAAYVGRVQVIRMSHDWLAPPSSIERLQFLAPRAEWTVREFGAEKFQTRRPDHFGWLREPAAVVSEFAAWQGLP